MVDMLGREDERVISTMVSSSRMQDSTTSSFTTYRRNHRQLRKNLLVFKPIGRRDLK
jgi:hypothetical protein